MERVTIVNNNKYIIKSLSSIYSNNVLGIEVTDEETEETIFWKRLKSSIKQNELKREIDYITRNLARIV